MERRRLGSSALEVSRLSLGAMTFGTGMQPISKVDAAQAERMIERAIDAGVNLIDTADAYGPEVSENLIAEALHPYPGDLVIATKGGLVRPGPGSWEPDGRPEHLREACENSLRRLRLDRIDLYQLHAVDPKVPFEQSLEAIATLREEGKVRLVGLSNVSVDQLERALEIVPVASVQNRYNLEYRASEEVLEACEEGGIGFIPWFPLATGSLARPGGPLDEIAAAHDATPSQIALAWLLARSPVMLPIPGTSSVEHLEENLAAAHIALGADEVDELGGLKG